MVQLGQLDPQVLQVLLGQTVLTVQQDLLVQQVQQVQRVTDLLAEVIAPLLV